MRIGRSLGMMAVVAATACSQPSKTVEQAPTHARAAAVADVPDWLKRPPYPQPHDFPTLETFAAALALHRAPFPEHARVLSVRAAPDQTYACGWIQVTPAVAAPFQVGLVGPFPNWGLTAIGTPSRRDLLRGERSTASELYLTEVCANAGAPLGPRPRLSEAGV